MFWNYLKRGEKPILKAQRGHRTLREKDEDRRRWGMEKGSIIKSGQGGWMLQSFWCSSYKLISKQSKRTLYNFVSILSSEHWKCTLEIQVLIFKICFRIHWNMSATIKNRFIFSWNSVWENCIFYICTLMYISKHFYKLNPKHSPIWYSIWGEQTNNDFYTIFILIMLLVKLVN